MEAFVAQLAAARSFSWRLLSIKDFMGIADSPLLSPAEKRILADFTLPKKRAQWLAGRHAAKKALFDFLGTAAPEAFNQVEIINGINQAPIIRQFPKLHLSISHSFPYCIAVVGSGKIGVDVEKHFLPIKPMLDLYYTETENSLIQGAETDDLRACMAAQLWTRKEAISKLLGIGMKLNFKKIDATADKISLAEWAHGFTRLYSYDNMTHSISFAIEE